MKKLDFSFKFPLLFIGFSFCIFSATFTPTVYGTGGIGGGRAVNIMFFFYLLLLFADVTYLLGWLHKKILMQKIDDSKTNHISLPYFASAFLFMILSCNWLAINTFSSVSAYYSLTTGEAKTYDAEMGSRFTLYGDKSKTNVEVNAFSVRPYVLYFDDITTEADDIKNYQAACFFGKETIKIKAAAE